jgi:hypothetical protein
MIENRDDQGLYEPERSPTESKLHHIYWCTRDILQVVTNLLSIGMEIVTA